ncbi:hypothetical protein OC845_003761 [Tilletia horrida]|nr:hypothetical protein OC845_003761 [Tilletia horrida]
MLDPPSRLLDTRRSIAAQYAARLPPRSTSFTWPTDPSALLAVQAYLDDDLFQQDDGAVGQSSTASSRSRIAPASTSYDTRFLKTLIEKLQHAIGQTEDPDGELEIDDRLMERYVSLLAIPNVPNAPPPASKIQYFYPSPLSLRVADDGSQLDNREHADILHDLNSILLDESGTMISSGTTGLRTWEASLQVANHIVSSPPGSSTPLNLETIIRPSTRVLELGSGVGMLDASVVLTDVPGPVLETLEGTLRQNDLASSELVQVAALDWVELSNESDTGSIHTWLHALGPNVILAADVVFDPDLCRPLAKTIRAALEAGFRADLQQEEMLPVAYIASTVRNLATYSTFKTALADAQLEFRPIDLQPERLTVPLLPTRTDPASSACETGNQAQALGPPAGLSLARIFPSTHDPQRDGHVELLEIRCRR